MSPKRTYFGLSTPQQRKLLFESWEESGSVSQACQKARVSRGLFYYWKPRFDKKGYAGLETFESRVAHKLNYKDEAIQKRVIELRQQNPDWGKAGSHKSWPRNNWVPLVSANTVKGILQKANLWPERGSGGKRN